MNKEHIEVWISALESDEYTQTNNMLRRRYVSVDGRHREAYCALGVAMEVAIKHGVEVASVDWLRGGLSYDVAQWYGFAEHNAKPLVELDDGHEVPVSDLNDNGWTFWDIAQALRAKFLKEGT